MTDKGRLIFLDMPRFGGSVTQMFDLRAGTVKKVKVTDNPFNKARCFFYPCDQVEGNLAVISFDDFKEHSLTPHQA
jgi:hypothetical protein